MRIHAVVLLQPWRSFASDVRVGLPQLPDAFRSTAELDSEKRSAAFIESYRHRSRAMEITVLRVADLRPYAKKPTGISDVTLSGQTRLVFSEGLGSSELSPEAERVVHWPVSILSPP